ncbi:MAG: hypothetical protein OXU19_11590 [bacterium]|nr:hypothetical protein [bacterium]
MLNDVAHQLSAEAARACLTTCGGFAFAGEHDVEHKGCQARLSRIASVSPNLMLGFIGQHVPSVPKSG